MPSRGFNIPQQPPIEPPTEPEAPEQLNNPAPKQPATAAKTIKKDTPNNTSNTDLKPLPSIKQIFAEGRLRTFLGVLLILLSGYTLIACISYLSTGSADQSVVENHTMAEISKNTAEVKNAGGKFGAFFSSFFISQWLGLASFLIIFYTASVGLALLKYVRLKFWQFTFKILMSAIAMSIIIGSLTYWTDSSIFWGGRHGHYVTEFFYDNTAVWGTLCMNLIMATIVVLIFFKPIKNCYDKVYVALSNYKAKLVERYNESMSSADDAGQTPPAPQETPVPVNPSVTVSTPSETHDTQLPTDVATNIPQPVINAVETPKEQPAHNPVPEVRPAPLGFEVSPYVPSVSDTSASANNTEPKQTAGIGNADMIVVDHNPIVEAEEIDIDAYDPTAELSRFRFPSIDLLHVRESSAGVIDEAEQEENKNVIINALRSYGVEIASIKATVGPTITLYEIIPAEGVRIAKIKRLGDDMTLSLSAIGIRIIAPMPGKGTIGMEVPNKNPQTVSIRSILSSKAYQESKAELPMAMGTTITNEVYVTDLAKMPHLLVAGATGMGKSVGLNTIIASLLYKKHPAELKFVLVDPKMVEFSLYKCLERHYLAKLPEEDDAIITDPNKVVATLNSLCVEMDNRYALLSQAGMRGIKEYNQKFISRRLNPEKGHRYLPYIVVIIDEFADLIITAGKEVETPISRIAAKARAVGIHMILATQRPSVNVITGVIKANFPGRMAFRVTQMNDSRTILDRPGADQLIGRGDMLISRDGVIERVQCAFIDTDEVEAMCHSIAEQTGYANAYELPEYITPQEGSASAGRGNIADRDPLFADAGRAVIESGTGSTSYLQRKYNIGYPRAGKIMDQLEAAGVVGASQGGKPRSVLMDSYSFERLLEV